MRFTLLIISVLFFAVQEVAAQVINVPDINFKNALLDAGVDINNDGELQVSEALMITELDISDQNITDVTGIAHFTNLTKLSCKYNQIGSLDLTNNVQLTELYCQHNQLTSVNLTNITNLTKLSCQENQLNSLDITTNINLAYLYCNNNLLTDLDLTSNTYLLELNCVDNQLSDIEFTYNSNLTTLFCNDNALVSLDLTHNTNLQEVYCQSNELTYLDLRNGNNIAMQSFEAFNNPDLICILVDNAPASTTIWSAHIDNIASFINDPSECTELSVATIPLDSSDDIQIYPNPTTGILNFNFPEDQLHSVRIINSLGQIVHTYAINDRFFQVNLNNTIARGMYYVKIIGDNNQLIDTRKVILK